LEIFSAEKASLNFGPLSCDLGMGCDLLAILWVEKGFPPFFLSLKALWLSPLLKPTFFFLKGSLFSPFVSSKGKSLFLKMGIEDPLLFNPFYGGVGAS